MTNGSPTLVNAEERRGRMTRLSPEFYRGHSFVHWSMTIEARRTGWLTPEFHHRFREVQLHALSRYRLVCLVYCLMPDHLHLLWAGLSDESDQDKAAGFMRKYLNRLLAEEDGTGSRSAPGSAEAERSNLELSDGAARLPAPGEKETDGTGSRSAPGSGFALQKQAWDVVLRDRDRERNAIERLLFYISENPVRRELVKEAREWLHSGSQAAGFPQLDWRQEDFRQRLWTIYEAEVRRFGSEP